MDPMNACDPWHVRRVTADEYLRLVPDREVFFNEPRFAELNRDRADELHYLLVQTGESIRFALILGKTGTVAACPFSAPYSYPVAVKAHPQTEHFDRALPAVEDYCRSIGAEELRFVFPPLFYHEDLLSSWISTFYRSGYTVSALDLNFHLDLDSFTGEWEDYLGHLTQLTRRLLHRSIHDNLSVKRCENEEDYRHAYEIMKAGHDSKGYPVKLSFERLMSTMKLVTHDAFIVLYGDTGIAAQFNYEVTPRIVQTIYRGSLASYAHVPAATFLLYYETLYYKAKGYRYLDEAISTLDSIPNYGLCDFKERMGETRTLKYSFIKRLI